MFYGILLTDDDVAEVRELFHVHQSTLIDLSRIYQVDYRYLHKVVWYEVRTQVPDLPGVIRRHKRTYNKSAKGADI